MKKKKWILFLIIFTLPLLFPEGRKLGAIILAIAVILILNLLIMRNNAADKKNDRNGGENNSFRE